jgi:hypothetical protein
MQAKGVAIVEHGVAGPPAPETAGDGA